MSKGVYVSHHLTIVVARIKKYIDEHPLEVKTTNELAELAGVSRNLLQKGFKQINNIHIKDYYVAAKMVAAKQMLQEGMPVKQVARHCRYKSHSAFTTAFKKRFGTPPLRWIRQKK